MCWEKNNIVIVFNIHGIIRFNALHIIILYDDFKCVSTKRESVSENWPKKYVKFKCPLPNSVTNSTNSPATDHFEQFKTLANQSINTIDTRRKVLNRVEMLMQKIIAKRHGVPIILIWHDIKERNLPTRLQKSYSGI